VASSGSRLKQTRHLERWGRGFPLPFDLALDLRALLVRLALRADGRVRFGLPRSGSSARPVSRFHRSYASGVISPFTSSSAYFRRWALLLKGIGCAV
jgi:hypothetical protein